MTPNEWRERLVILIASCSDALLDSDWDARVGRYLSALLCEWDAHEPIHAPALLKLTGKQACRECDKRDADGLCAARRRMMG